MFKRPKSNKFGSQDAGSSNNFDVGPRLSRDFEATPPAMGELAPPSAVERAEYDTREMLVSVNRRMQKAVVVSAFASLASAVALLAAMPLKTVVPYVVEVDNASGAVNIPDQQVASKFAPSFAVQEFFVRRWVEDLMTIHPETMLKVHAPRAQAYIRGQAAIGLYNNFRTVDNTFTRLAEDPSLLRTVEVKDLAPVAGTANGAVANLVINTVKAGKLETSTTLLTIYWSLVPPATPEELKKNPIGIYITDFRFSSTPFAK